MYRLWLLTALMAALPAHGVIAASPDNDSGRITVSGISAGAQMAHQLHIAYPEVFSGAGLIAGGPFGCAEGSLATAMTRCMGSVKGELPLAQFVDEIRAAAQRGQLGETSGLADDRVWIFHGALDTTVAGELSDATVAIYSEFMPSASIRYVNDVQAAHTFPTRGNGKECTLAEAPFMGDCDYDAAGELLQYLLGTLEQPAGGLELQAVETVLPGASSAGLLEAAYTYIPTACEKPGSSCRVHLVLHGCGQSSAQLGSAFVQQSGYLPWAEANNIILAFPQVAASTFNPIACWDWWGYTGASYRWRNGAQMKVLADWVQGLSSP